MPDDRTVVAIRLIAQGLGDISEALDLLAELICEPEEDDAE